MSVEQERQSKRVLSVIREIAAEKPEGFRPGDVASHLRNSGFPIAVWAIRGEFSSLEAQGAIVLDPESGTWTLAQDTAERQAAG